LPVIRPNVLESHRSGFPLVCGAHHQWSFTVIFEGLQYVHELFASCWFLQAVLVQDVLVVEEPMDHRGHGYTENITIVICNPGALGDIPKILDTRQIV